MAKNKNAMRRYEILDEMLSDRHHYYSTNDLLESCNERLIEQDEKGQKASVGIRCIQKDLEYIQSQYANIERYVVGGKRCVRYEDREFSIFKKKLTVEERHLLSELLNTIGQFEGLEHFEFFERFRSGLKLKEEKKIISFSHNPYLMNSNLLGELFDKISNQVAVELEYHKFTDDVKKRILFFPYLLKQYNDRWFVLGAAEDGKVLTFALDRIDSVTAHPEVNWYECGEDLEARFEDIVGVTLYEDREVEKVLFWVSDDSKNYVETKPIHGSQVQIKGEKEEALRQKYPTLTGGKFFKIQCIPNYELIRELCAYGKALLVLGPSTIQDEVFKRVSEQSQQYSAIRTKNSL